jgi:predicted ABC-type transport system involved in lysophospholipase L1 biosynthesis ATPase subunit
MDHRQTGPTESLAAVDQRIAKAKALIVRQEILVARLAAGGGDLATGRALLEEMRSTLAEMYQHRQRLLRKTAAAGSR